ncbi:MAG: undecaprenyl/decaprenyl-phosphate alpha-N-acetylglucosaminyl 1-phosphate transferase [Leptospiraceae bacterium]|nr:undecaprenyl/decaprenyl-phosphate alpha-N-acetylglucosaminyl 1-phosphate transferase [Leptospiraceae bacterium]MDW8307039.1 MraY family glycosyltransferase [Leptospiraceae bacterium]
MVSAIIVFLISFAVALAFLPLTIYLSDKFSLYDTHNERKIHKGKISRLGGLSFFLGFLVSILVMQPYYAELSSKGGLLLGGLLAFLLGFIDDLSHNIRARYKLLLQLFVGLIVALAGYRIESIQLTQSQQLELGLLSFPLTMLWIAGFMNAINLLDGLDGLAGGIMLLAFLFLGLLGYRQANFMVMVLALAIGGGLLAFLIYNFPPAKIFMGDGGAYFLGFLYAITPLLGIKKSSSITVLLLPLVLLLIPLLDMLHVMQRRVKNGEHIFWADKKHIHHRLLHIGFSNRGILWLLYGYTTILGAFSLLMIDLNPVQNWFILILLFLLTAMVFYTVAKAEEQVLIKNTNEKNKKIKKQTRILAFQPKTKYTGR